MMRGALRRHPDLQKLNDDLVGRLDLHLHHDNGGDSDSGGDGVPNNKTALYMALHARVEQDMQRHPVSWKQKERNVTKIDESWMRVYAKASF